MNPTIWTDYVLFDQTSGVFTSPTPYNGAITDAAN